MLHTRKIRETANGTVTMTAAARYEIKLLSTFKLLIISVMFETKILMLMAYSS